MGEAHSWKNRTELITQASVTKIKTSWILTIPTSCEIHWSNVFKHLWTPEILRHTTEEVNFVMSQRALIACWELSQLSDNPPQPDHLMTFQTCERSNKAMKQKKGNENVFLWEAIKKGAKYRLLTGDLQSLLEKLEWEEVALGSKVKKKKKKRYWMWPFSRLKLFFWRANWCLRHYYQHLMTALLHQECRPSATSCTTSAARSRTRTWRSRSPCAAGHFTTAPTCSSPACSSPAWPCWSSCSPPTPGRRFHWVRPQDTHALTHNDSDSWWQSHEKKWKKQKKTKTSHLSGIFTLAASTAKRQLVYFLLLYANADIKPTDYLLLWGFTH